MNRLLLQTKATTYSTFKILNNSNISSNILVHSNGKTLVSSSTKLEEPQWESTCKRIFSSPSIKLSTCKNIDNVFILWYKDNMSIYLLVPLKTLVTSEKKSIAGINYR